MAGLSVCWEAGALSAGVMHSAIRIRRDALSSMLSKNKHDGLLGRHSGTAWSRVQARLEYSKLLVPDEDCGESSKMVIAA